MSSCCCEPNATGKTKQRSDEERRCLMNRLSRVEGQVRGVKRQLEENVYCVDILMQVSAIQAALNAFSRELLNNHIKTCVADGIREGDDEVVDELCNMLQKLMK